MVATGQEGHLRRYTTTTTTFAVEGGHNTATYTGAESMCAPGTTIPRVSGMFIVPAPVSSALRAFVRRCLTLVRAQGYVACTTAHEEDYYTPRFFRNEARETPTTSPDGDVRTGNTVAAQEGAGPPRTHAGIFAPRGVPVNAVVVCLPREGLSDNILALPVTALLYSFLEGAGADASLHAKRDDIRITSTYLGDVRGLPPQLVMRLIEVSPIVLQAALVAYSGGQVLPSTVGERCSTLCFSADGATNLCVQRMLPLHCLSDPQGRHHARVLDMPFAQDPQAHHVHPTLHAMISSLQRCTQGVRAARMVYRARAMDMTPDVPAIDSVVEAAALINSVDVGMRVYAVAAGVREFPINCHALLMSAPLQLGNPLPAEFSAFVAAMPSGVTAVGRIPVLWGPPLTTWDTVMDHFANLTDVTSGTAALTGYFFPKDRYEDHTVNPTWGLGIRMSAQPSSVGSAIVTLSNTEVLVAAFHAQHPQLQSTTIDTIVLELASCGLVPEVTLRVSHKVLPEIRKKWIRKMGASG
eukprot:Lankesteria_metandrocarpae@DN8309_c0_g1_i1.p1